MANSKSRIALIAWLGLVAMLSGTVAIHAQEPCGAQYDNFGIWQSHNCYYNQCGIEEDCEYDGCYCNRTGSHGYIEYCVVADSCGMYPGCNRC